MRKGRGNGKLDSFLPNKSEVEMEVGDFLGDSVLLVRTEVKRSWALLTANVLGNFVKYMLFTAAYNIQKNRREKEREKHLVWFSMTKKNKKTEHKQNRNF